VDHKQGPLERILQAKSDDPTILRLVARANALLESDSRIARTTVSCDVPGRCSLKRVAHPGDFRQSESSSNEQVDRKVPDKRAQECAKLPGKSRAAGQTSMRTRMVVLEASEAAGISDREGGSGSVVGGPKN
jgi:hypothetical protein